MSRFAIVAVALTASLSAPAAAWSSTQSAKTPSHPASRGGKTSATTSKRGTKPPETPAPADASAAPPPAAAPAPSVVPPPVTPAPVVPPPDSMTGTWLLVLAGVVAVAGALQWWGLRRMGRAVEAGLERTRDAADAAAASAAAAAKALAASERAYLVTRGWTLRPPSSGDTPEVEFVVENVGRTPARKTMVRGHVEVRDTPLPPAPKWRAVEASGGTLTIPPGGRPSSTLAADAPITREEIERLRSGAAYLSIWGRVDYEDVLGAAQSVSFAWRYDMASGSLTYDPASDAYHEAT